MFEQSQAKPLHEVLDMITANCVLQVNDIDVAIPYLVGAPGGGKTMSINSLCKENNWGLVSSHFALKPLEETGGIPQFENVHINGEDLLGTTWSFPDIMKELYILSEKYSNENEMVIWLLDDMHLCGAVHMAIMYELLTERKLREYKLPDNVAIVLAGNHASNKAGAKTMFSAIVNRIVLMPIYTSFEGWKKNFAIPNNVHPAIVSFLENDQYEAFFHEEEQVDSPWGSPRAWTRLSNVVRAYESWLNHPMKDDQILYLATGHIGKEGASEFTTYYHIFSKFDIEAILNAGQTYELPDNPVDRYALAYALTSNLVGRNDRKKVIPSFAAVTYKYLKEYPDLGLMIIHELLNLEKVLNKRNLYMDVVKQLNVIEPGITKDLLQEASDV